MKDITYKLPLIIKKKNTIPHDSYTIIDHFFKKYISSNKPLLALSLLIVAFILPLRIITKTYSHKLSSITLPQPTTYTISALPNIIQPSIAQWPIPQAQSQDGLWFYELFSPPTIILTNNTWSSIPYYPSSQTPPGWTITHFENTPYSIRFEGYCQTHQEPPQYVHFIHSTPEIPYTILDFSPSAYNADSQTMSEPYLRLFTPHTQDSIELKLQETCTFVSTHILLQINQTYHTIRHLSDTIIINNTPYAIQAICPTNHSIVLKNTQSPNNTLPFITLSL